MKAQDNDMQRKKKAECSPSIGLSSPSQVGHSAPSVSEWRHPEEYLRAVPWSMDAPRPYQRDQIDRGEREREEEGQMNKKNKTWM